MKKLRVVVAEDHDMLRSHITAYLRRMAEVNLVGEAMDGEEAIKCVDELNPDLLILDYFMPKMSGRQVLQHLHEQQARVKVIFFATNDKRYFGTVPYHGVVAYIVKENIEALGRAVGELAQQKATG
jgi:DNA-binding NarL/FixJ family response regulator